MLQSSSTDGASRLMRVVPASALKRAACAVGSNAICRAVSHPLLPELSSEAHLSSSNSWSSDLPQALRELGQEGWRVVHIVKFSKPNDRLGALGARVCEYVPRLLHKGILVLMEPPHKGAGSFWLRLEFVLEGIIYTKIVPEALEFTTYPSWEELILALHPEVVAEILEKNQKEYNAILWNCQHFADFVWAELTSEERASASFEEASESGGSLSRSSPSDGEERTVRFRSDSLSAWLAEGVAPRGNLGTPRTARYRMSISANVAPENTESEECNICAEEPRQVVFVPCGHFLSCVECAATLVECPRCDVLIQLRQRVAVSAETESNIVLS